MNKTFIHSYEKLNLWIEDNGFAGYDPYDLKGKSWMIKLISLGNKYYFFEVIREIILEFFLMFPLFFRKLFGTSKKVNAKAVGLLASSYIDMDRVNPSPATQVKIDACFDWLENNKAKTKAGTGWGYPFDWQSQQLIPANTPNGIVTTAVADAYWKKYQSSGESKYLDASVSIAEFLYSLPKDEYSEDMLCFSYTPLFINHVHNLNLFVAEHLLKVGTEKKIKKYINIAWKAIKYTINDQNEDGSFEYNGPPKSKKGLVDHYHTGFNMRMLYSIWKISGNNEVKDALDKCYNHYINNFFDGPKPKFAPHRLYRIDIHSVSECVHCLYTLAPDYPKGVDIADQTLKWAIEELQDDEGWFYHGIFKSKMTGKVFKSKVPYMRWAQAWMMRAFTSVYFATSEVKPEYN